MAVIYWIHKDKNEDYLKDGYIGITNNLKNRMRLHYHRPANKKLGNYINKYGWDNLIKEVIFEGTEEEVKLFEEYLRPTINIGLNHNEGGGLPPNHKGFKRSKLTIQKQKEHLLYPHNYYLEIPFIKSNIEASKKYDISIRAVKSIKEIFKKGKYDWLFKKYNK